MQHPILRVYNFKYMGILALAHIVNSINSRNSTKELQLKDLVGWNSDRALTDTVKFSGIGFRLRLV